MDRLKLWLSAMRLRTLPLSVSGIVVGTCIAYSQGFYRSTVFVMALITTVALQILSNLANDYGDGVKGTDNYLRIGPIRAIQSGKISPAQMFTAIKWNIAIAVLSAVLLIYFSFGIDNMLFALLFLLLAGVAIYAALSYTVGSSPYGYKGLGDLFVFIFFGVLSVSGTYVLYTLNLNAIVILPAISIGLLSTGVLNLNNMRDIASDAQSGKNTFAVKLGPQKARQYHILLIVGAMVAGLIFIYLHYSKPLISILLFAYIPLIVHLKKVIKVTVAQSYDPELKFLALTTFLFSVLMGLGMIIS